MNDIGVKLKETLIDLDIDGIQPLIENALKEGINPHILVKYLIDGMRSIGDQFEQGDVYLSELLMASEMMKNALDIIKPYISKNSRKSEGTVIIGTVEGDVHDIGKNLIKTMLKTNGFDVVDLGVDVPTSVFIDKVREIRPDILAISSLLTTTMPKIVDIIEALENADLRNQVKIMIGGATIRQEWASNVGADGFAPDMVSAIKVCQNLLSNS